MRNKKVLFITQAALIAAIYVVMTVFIQAFGLASGNIQVRISEALCVLPVFIPAAIPGLGIGCVIANLVTGASVFDVVFGSLATLIGAIGTYLLRKKKFLCTLPPVVANMIAIPFILRYVYGLTFIYNDIDFSIPMHALTVGIGEVISVCILGSILLRVLDKYRDVIFKNN